MAWHSGRTSVSGRRTFPVLRSTCSWWVTTNVGKVSATGQPTRPTQPFILSGSIKWVVSWNQMCAAVYRKRHLVNATGVTAGPAESNGRPLLGIWCDSLHVTCGLTVCTPGSAPGPTLGNECGKTLPFTIHTSDYWSYIRRKQTAIHLLTPPENVTTLTCEMQNFFIWLKVCCFLSNFGGSETSSIDNGQYRQRQYCCGLSSASLKRTGWVDGNYQFGATPFTNFGFGDTHPAL